MCSTEHMIRPSHVWPGSHQECRYGWLSSPAWSLLARWLHSQLLRDRKPPRRLFATSAASDFGLHLTNWSAPQHHRARSGHLSPQSCHVGSPVTSPPIVSILGNSIIHQGRPTRASLGFACGRFQARPDLGTRHQSLTFRPRTARKSKPICARVPKRVGVLSTIDCKENEPSC